MPAPAHQFLGKEKDARRMTLHLPRAEQPAEDQHRREVSGGLLETYDGWQQLVQKDQPLKGTELHQ
ncbi:hypothetical protein D3C76_1662450 [compost metagenome]